MEIRTITDTYLVTPQICVDDLPQIIEAGIKTILCNRPDTEVPPSHQAEAIEAAAVAAGLMFHILPLTHQSMTPDVIAQQMEYARSEVPVLAYCASGTRCTVAWAIGSAGEGHDIDQILSTTEQAGYPLEGLRSTLEAVPKNSTR